MFQEEIKRFPIKRHKAKTKVIRSTKKEKGKYI